MHVLQGNIAEQVLWILLEKLVIAQIVQMLHVVLMEPIVTIYLVVPVVTLLQFLVFVLLQRQLLLLPLTVAIPALLVHVMGDQAVVDNLMLMVAVQLVRNQRLSLMQLVQVHVVVRHQHRLQRHLLRLHRLQHQHHPPLQYHQHVHLYQEVLVLLVHVLKVNIVTLDICMVVIVILLPQVQLQHLLLLHPLLVHAVVVLHLTAQQVVVLIQKSARY